jgi:hypothetical protein
MKIDGEEGALFAFVGLVMFLLHPQSRVWILVVRICCKWRYLCFCRVSLACVFCYYLCGLEGGTVYPFATEEGE